MMKMDNDFPKFFPSTLVLSYMLLLILSFLRSSLFPRPFVGLWVLVGALDAREIYSLNDSH
jgi:hypothetical protein